MKNDIDLLKNTLTLQELSECCVCMHPLRPSHSLCATGHGVCGKCKSALTECPMCKKMFVLDNAILLNQILELLPKTCQYYNKGCTFAGCSRDHEEFCIFRPSQCRMINCGFEGTVKDVVDHVKSDHKEKVLEIFPNSKKSGVLQFKNMTSHVVCYTPVVYNENFFWKYLHKDRAKRVLTHAFYHVPFAQPTKTYALTVEYDKLEEKLNCLSQIETVGQRCDVLETVTERHLESTEKLDDQTLEVPEATESKPEISEELAVEGNQVIPEYLGVQKVKISEMSVTKNLSRSDKNDVLISTTLLSRKRDKKGGYNYKYSVSIQETPLVEE